MEGALFIITRMESAGAASAIRVSRGSETTLSEINTMHKKIDRNNKMIEMADAGMTYAKIATEMGISRARVGQIMLDNGRGNKSSRVNTERMAKKLYAGIIKYKADNDGNTPTVAEMMEIADTTTYAVLSRALECLETNGLIEINRKQMSNRARYTRIKIIGAEWRQPSVYILRDHG